MTEVYIVQEYAIFLMLQVLFIHDLSFWLQLYMLTSDNLQAKSSSVNQLIHEQIKDLNVAWMITDGKYQFCNLDCESRNTCYSMLVNVIMKHAGKGVGVETQRKS